MIATCNPPPLPYTPQESNQAFNQWKANCGPHSLSAYCQVSLPVIRETLTNFEGWMKPSSISKSLRKLGIKYQLKKGLKTQQLCQGINRIQWEGPWLEKGVPAKEAYSHTHYIAHNQGWVLCTAITSHRWIQLKEWRSLLLEGKTPTPFHITHHYQIKKT